MGDGIGRAAEGVSAGGSAGVASVQRASSRIVFLRRDEALVDVAENRS